MQKINTSLQHRIVYALASFLSVCVFVLSIHAKDVLHYVEETKTGTEYHDLSAKATGDLHDHVQKQIIKTFDKSSGDNYVIHARPKQDLDILNEEDPGLWGRMHETLLLFGIYASLPLSLKV